LQPGKVFYQRQNVDRANFLSAATKGGKCATPVPARTQLLRVVIAIGALGILAGIGGLCWFAYRRRSRLQGAR